MRSRPAFAPGEGSIFTGTKITFNCVRELEDLDEVLATFRAPPPTKYAARRKR